MWPGGRAGNIYHSTISTASGRAVSNLQHVAHMLHTHQRPGVFTHCKGNSTGVQLTAIGGGGAVSAN
jgi:hypothetical protein